MHQQPPSREGVASIDRTWGSLVGTVRALAAPTGETDQAQPVEVTFNAEVSKPRSVVMSVAVFVIVLILGLAIPLALLYFARWKAAVIPPRTLMSEEFDVEVRESSVLRGGEPLRLRAEDLRAMVSIPAKGARMIEAGSVTLRTRLGWSPVGEGYAQVLAPDEPVVTSTGSAVGSAQAGRLPIAVHNNWIAWPSGKGPRAARLLLLVGVDATDEQRAEIVRSVIEQLPGAFESAADGDGAPSTAADGGSTQTTRSEWDNWDDDAPTPPKSSSDDGWDDVEFRFND